MHQMAMVMRASSAPRPRAPQRKRRVKIGALSMRSKTRNLVDDEERRRDRPLRKAKEERRPPPTERCQ
jgi:hypothetical protein